jgi:hypothetical protein
LKGEVQMMNYADYDFYKEEFKGSLSNDLFSSLIIKASREIDRNVNRELTEEVINSLSDRDQYKLKFTACELVDYFNVNGSNSSNAKANSISIDGVSVNRGSKTETQATASKRNIINNLPNELTRYI